MITTSPYPHVVIQSNRLSPLRESVGRARSTLPELVENGTLTSSGGWRTLLHYRALWQVNHAPRVSELRRSAGKSFTFLDALCTTSQHQGPHQNEQDKHRHGGLKHRVLGHDRHQ